MMATMNGDLSLEQRAFFDTFGFLVLKGTLASEIGWITDEFEHVFRDRGIVHDGTKRSCVVPFIDQRERLCKLLDHPVIEGLGAGLLGEEFAYLGGDGNYYSGDTSWHSDGYHTVGKFLKIALYLDPVRRDSGALRAIPGSHRLELRDWQGLRAREAESVWGITQSEVPAIALESDPGDVVAFNHNLMHASFGGSAARRMFTLNLCSEARSEAEIRDLRDYINGHDRFWLEHLHSDVMRSSAGPGRMRHLQQVMELEDELAERSKQAMASMGAPANG